MSPLVVASLVLVALQFIRSVVLPAWPINHDCAMYVSAGLDLVAGGKPYVDFIDLNPPLIFYLNAFPAWLTHLTGMEPALSFALCINLWCVLGALSLLSLLRAQRNRDVAQYLGAILLAYCAFNYITVEWGEFGQRQQLAADGLVVLFALRWLRWTDVWVPPIAAVAGGIICGIGLSLVPQYAIMAIAVEAWYLATARQWRKLLASEVFAAGAIAVAYGIHFWFLPAVVKDIFFHRWLPLVMAGYSSYNCDWQALTTFPIIIGCTPLFVIALLLSLRARCSLTMPALIFCIGGYVAVLIQLKGWYNHYLPFLAGSLMYAAVQTYCFFARGNANPRAWRLLGTIAGIYFVSVAPAVAIRENLHYPNDELTSILRESRAGDSVMIISANAPDVYPALLLSGRKNGSRYLFLFPIQMAEWLKDHGKSQKDRDFAVGQEHVLFSELREDLDHSQPKLLLIPDDPHPKGVAILPLLEGAGLLAQIQRDYARIGDVKTRVEVLSLWKRKTANASRLNTPSAAPAQF